MAAILSRGIKISPTKIDLSTIGEVVIALEGLPYTQSVSLEVGGQKANVNTRSLIHALLAIQPGAADTKTRWP